MGPLEAIFFTLGVSYDSNPFPLSSAGWLPPELLAFWTRCAQVPPRVLRRRPPLEAEEEAEREAAAEEERRRAETLSEIEVSVPTLPPLKSQSCALPEPL